MRFKNMFNRLAVLSLSVILLFCSMFSSPATSTVEAKSSVYCIASADLALILDSSSSIGSDVFTTQVKAFASDYAESFKLSPTDGRLGIVQFSTNVSVEIGLSTDVNAVKGAIAGMPYLNDLTDIAGGISTASGLLSGGGRSPRVAVLVTDGEQTVGGDPVAAASAARSAGTSLFVVGVGSGVNQGVLSQIAGGPVFLVQNFDQLVSAVSDIVRATCTLANGIVTTSPTAGAWIIPPGSTMGQLTRSVRIYWEPDYSKAIVPEIILPAGNTFWVIGTAPCKPWYQIIVGGQYAWIPADAIGNYDGAYWGGSSLPPTGTGQAVKAGKAGKGPGGELYVVYDGYVKVGGSRSWRNNNPGNIRSAPANANSRIAINDRFAVFADDRIGWDALITLLKTPKYSKKSIAEAMQIYAPELDKNNPAAYTAFIEKRTGLDASRIVGTLTDDELNKFGDAIRTYEGWTEGLKYIAGDNANPDWVKDILQCGKK